MHNIPLHLIPPQGLILAYFSNGILFDTYTVSEGRIHCQGLIRFADDTMTECHLFNRDTEYRAIFSQAQGQWITATLDKSQEQLIHPDLLYTQTVLVKKEYATRNDLPTQLHIINRYQYSAHDTLQLTNYRISY